MAAEHHFNDDVRLKGSIYPFYSQAWKNGRPKSLRFLNRNTFFHGMLGDLYFTQIHVHGDEPFKRPCYKRSLSCWFYGLPTGMWKAEDECENEEDSDGLLSSSVESHQEEPNNRSQSLSAIGHLGMMVSQSKTAHINVTCFICGLIRIVSELSPR